MEIIVKIGGQWKDDREAHAFFELHRKWVAKRVSVLQKEFNFRPPSKLLLRPYYFKNGISPVYGRAEYNPFKPINYHLMLCVPVCLKEKDKGLWVTDHELSHIVCAIKYKDWSHGKNFKQIYEYCRNGKK